MRHYRFTCLLAALLLMMFVSPFVRFFRTDAFPILAPISMVLLFSAVLLSAVFAVSKNRRTILIAGSWVAVVIAIEVLYVTLEKNSLLMLQNALSAGLLAYTLALLLRFLFTERRITFEAISASLCGYLLLGVFWASLYTVLLLVDPSSFNYPQAPGIVASADPMTLRFGTEGSASALYFSYVTLTTLGYGDITPATVEARMLCTVEAIAGQLYLAVLVARLVGLHIAHQSRDHSERA